MSDPSLQTDDTDPAARQLWDEIERLRALVADLEQGRDNGYKIIAELRAELFRLRTEHAKLVESATEVEIERDALRERGDAMQIAVTEIVDRETRAAIAKRFYELLPPITEELK